jgi:hypothetical protein
MNSRPMRISPATSVRKMRGGISHQTQGGFFDRRGTPCDRVVIA